MNDASWGAACLREAITAVRLHSPDLTARQVHEQLVLQTRWEHVSLANVKKMIAKMKKASPGSGEEAVNDGTESDAVLSSLAVSDAKLCENSECSNPGVKLCSRCRKVRYCSTICQQAHHRVHKMVCVVHAAKVRADVLESAAVTGKESSSVSILENALSTCGFQRSGPCGKMCGGRCCECQIMSLLLLYMDAVSGKRDSFAQLKLLADGDRRFCAALKVLDAAKLRPLAAYGLGKLYSDDKVAAKLGMRTDSAKTTQYWVAAAKAGLAYAMCGLGNMLNDIHGERGQTSIDARGDTVKAMVWWAKAARTAAVPEAHFNTGVAYGLGMGGVSIDLQRAAHCYQLAATCRMDQAGELQSIFDMLGPIDTSQRTIQDRARHNLATVCKEAAQAAIDAPLAVPLPHSAAQKSKPKPHNVSQPRGLPPLFPGPAFWALHNMEGTMRQFADGMGMPLQTVQWMCDPYIRQRDLDHRMRHVHHVYGPDLRNKPMPLSEHCELFLRAGWDIRRAVASHSDFACAFNEAWELGTKANNGELVTVESYQAPTFPIPAECDYCGRPCVAECRCGETYCDRDCQASNWAAHKRICQTVVENNETGIMITEMFWGMSPSTAASEDSEDDEDEQLELEHEESEGEFASWSGDETRSVSGGSAATDCNV